MPQAAEPMVDETSSEWQPLKPKYVVQVSYDFTGGRFRHGTSILRWRPDKKPRQRTFEQLQQKIDQRLLAGHHLKQIVFRLGAGVVFHHCGGVRHQARPYIPAILSGLRHPFGRA